MIFIIALVFTFIIKIRFTKDVSIETIFKRRYGNLDLTYREVEKLDFKLTKINCDINFIELCKENNSTPTFLRIKLYNKDLSSSHLYKNFQRKLLDNKLKQKRTQRRILSRKLEFLKTNLQNHVSRFDFIHLLHLISNFNGEKTNSVKLIVKFITTISVMVSTGFVIP